MPSFVKVNKHRRGNESESESEIPSQIPASAVMMRLQLNRMVWH